MLAKASRDLADTGACRAFLVSNVELPTDQFRVDQENQVVPGLTADKDGMVFDINSEDSRNQRHLFAWLRKSTAMSRM